MTPEVLSKLAELAQELENAVDNGDLSDAAYVADELRDMVTQAQETGSYTPRPE